MILPASDSSQSKGGQIPLISLDLYKQSIPLKDEGRCSTSLTISLHPLLNADGFGGLLEVKEERQNVLSVKVPAIHISVRALEKICLQLSNML